MEYLKNFDTRMSIVNKMYSVFIFCHTQLSRSHHQVLVLWSCSSCRDPLYSGFSVVVARREPSAMWNMLPVTWRMFTVLRWIERRDWASHGVKIKQMNAVLLPFRPLPNVIYRISTCDVCMLVRKPIAACKIDFELLKREMKSGSVGSQRWSH